MKVCPLAIGEDANELSSALTVWSVESSNFQVTVVPTGTRPAVLADNGTHDDAVGGRLPGTLTR